MWENGSGLSPIDEMWESGYGSGLIPVDETWESGNGSASGSGSPNVSSTSSCSGNVQLHAEWIEKVFGQCVDTPLRYVAFVIGITSIAFWFFAQAPQIFTNCRSGIADKALSFWFLLLWLFGDATNLIGALLTGQLAPQIVAAVYYCFIDVVMMVQFLYYVVKNQGLRGLPAMLKCPKNHFQAAAIFLPGIMCTLLLANRPHMNVLLSVRDADGIHSEDYVRSGRVLLSDESNNNTPALDVHDEQMMIGYILGCISAVLYLLSRLPQIILNFAHCSVKGVSLTMFILAVLGNTTYSLGIVLYSQDRRFIIQSLPWIIGSAGTLCFDFIIFAQFILLQGLGLDCHKKKITDEEDPTIITNDYCR